MKHNLSNMKYAILDIDGTILDSMKAWENVTKDYLDSIGITADPDIREIVKTMTSEENAAYLQSHYHVSLDKDTIIHGLHQIIASKYAKDIPLKKSGIYILEYLKKHQIPFCGATSTDRKMIVSALERLHIADDFSFLLTCSEIGKGKQFPDIYKQSMRKLGGTISDTVVFEDALHCIETAKKAGFTVVGVYEEMDATDWEQIVKLSDHTIKL